MEDSHKHVAIVGGGVAGLTAATALADRGIDVTLIERSRRLGGHAAEWACMATDECARCSACLVQDLIRRTLAHPHIEVLANARVAQVDTDAACRTLALEPVADGAETDGDAAAPVLAAPRQLRAAATVLATGFSVYDPSADLLLGYGRFDQVRTIRELDHALARDDLEAFLPSAIEKPRLAFIQCVGSRDRQQGREYCSQFCCRATIRLVNRLLHLRPELEVKVFYIDLQIMSKEFESFYRQARDRVEFIQSVPAEVCYGTEELADKAVVHAIRQGAEKAEAFAFDRIVLATGLAPGAAQGELAERFGLAQNEFGFLAHSPDGATMTEQPGLFMAGACAGPTDIQGSRRTGLAAAAMAAGHLNRDEAERGPSQRTESSQRTAAGA